MRVRSGEPERGELWWCEHPDIGRRPVLVLSRDAAIRARGWAVVAACSTVERGLPSEVRLDPDRDPVPQLCVVALDAIESVSTGWLVERLGPLDQQRMREICAGLAVALDC